MPGSDASAARTVVEPALPAQASADEHNAHAVVAPLTGVYYRSPSPGAEPYVRAGVPVNAGQVIGLIEAMKLFNEIKSDVTGTVRRLVAGDGDLVKARQTLIEVDV
jgi:acetyl-CoA carboxylase biotin carboxyl carrier protein